MAKPKSIIDVNITDTSNNKDVSFEITEGVRLRDTFTKEVEEIKKDATVPSRIRNLENLTHCPRCSKPMNKALAIDDSESQSWLECPECGTLVNTFRPTTYQAEYLRRRERYKMSAGGFGTGKSRVNIEDVMKHLCLIPNAVVVVAARSYPALDATFKKEFESMFPKRLLRRKNEMKKIYYLTNGSILMYRSFDDPTKMKSLNLTMVVIIEASDVMYEAFTMMQSRIRNTAAMVPEVDNWGKEITYYDPRTETTKTRYIADARKINLETNPDSGWVKSKFLYDSKIVRFFGDAHDEGYKYNKDPDPEKYTQVVSTSANPYLPETYEEEQTRGKPKAYIQQFYKGSFNFSSNLVFPNAGTIIKAPHPLPKEFDEWGRRQLYYVIGLDYGINDPTHIVFGAFSVTERKLYIYDELRLNNSDVKTIAREYRHRIRTNSTNLEGLLMLPRFDGRSYNKRESDLHTIGGMFEAEGLYFEPSFAKHEPRIIKTNALINHGQLEIFSTCEFLIEELLNYKFKIDKRTGEPTDKPVDGKDHGITALEFITVELPHNLLELRLNVFLPAGMEIVHDTKGSKNKQKKKDVYNPLEANKNVRSINGYANGLNHGNARHYGVAPSIYDEDYERSDDRRDNFHDSERSNGLGFYIPGKRR